MRWIAEPKHGDFIDAKKTMYPTDLEVWRDPGTYEADGLSTVYGVVVEGWAKIETAMGALNLRAGSYFSYPEGKVIIPGGEAPTKVVTIARYGFRGQHAAGRLEQRGRLSYIDGCSDSMLVYPPRKGDPVLNHLHFPGDILQTQHTHPSIRVGVVMGGEGVSWRGEHGSKDDLRPFMGLALEHGLEYAVAYFDAWRAAVVESQEFPMGVTEIEFTVKGETLCVSASAEEHADLFSGVDMLYHLRAGGVFMLEESELHSFATVPGQNMEIVAYHPDSDWGPTDTNHPMLNRTYINHGQ